MASESSSDGKYSSLLVDFPYVLVLYSRHHDQVFFTWNGSATELGALMHTLKQRYSNVQFDYRIGAKVHFLDAEIENRQGQLSTRVYHDPNMRQYTLPYVVGHAKCQHRDWFRWALNRAVCYCSSVDDFYQERLYLELACLINDYSLLFVETQVDHFFRFVHGSEMRYCVDKNKYHSFRHQWFELMGENYTRSMRVKEWDEQGQVIRLHYLYEIGPRCLFNREFKQLWLKYFEKHPTLSKDKVTMLHCSKHLYCLNSLLSKQKSSFSVLLTL